MNKANRTNKTNQTRITYRLDANRRMEKERRQQEENGKVIPLYEEEYRVMEEGGALQPPERTNRAATINDYQPLETFKTDYGGWNSPFDAETERIEELIRRSEARRERRPEQPDRERSAGNNRPEVEEPDMERYDGQTGYYDSRYAYESERRRYSDRDAYEGPEVVGPRYVRHSRPPWIKVTAAVAGAAATGIVLGLLALTFFSGDGMKAPESLEALLEGGKKAPSAAKDVPASSANAGNQTGTANGASAAAAGQTFGQETALSLPAKTYLLLQNGSFAGPQGAEQAVGELQQKGFAAVAEKADRHYVYVGLASDKDSAQALGKQLQAAKVDIYVKAYALPAMSKARWTGDGETLKSYLDQSDKLLQMFSKLTLLHLEEAKPTPIDDSTLQAVKAAHETWSALANQVAQKAPEETKPALSQMNNALNAAKQSIDQYKKNPSPAMLWQAQNGMLQFLMAEKSLLGMIAVSV